MPHREFTHGNYQFFRAFFAASLLCVWAGIAVANTPSTWPDYFDGTRETGPYIWINGPAYNRKVPTLVDAIEAGHAGALKLYVCRAHYENGIHPGKFFNGQCNFGYGGREVAVGSGYEILISTLQKTPEAEPLLHRNWVSRSRLGSAKPFSGGTVGSTPLAVCRANHQGGVHPGKEWRGKCLIGYGGQEVSVSDYELLVLSFDKSIWQAATQVPSGPRVILQLKANGKCLKADGSDNLPFARCNTHGTEWIYEKGLLRPHAYPNVCLMQVYSRVKGDLSLKATPDCKNVDTPTMAGNAIWLLEKNASGRSRIRFVMKFVPGGRILENCLHPIGQLTGQFTMVDKCTNGDPYPWDLSVVPAPKYQAIKGVSSLLHGKNHCMHPIGIESNQEARNGTRLGMLTDCADHPLKHFIREMTPDNTGFRLRFAGTNLCMDIKSGVVYQPGSEIHLWTCHDLASQKWYQEGSQIRSGVVSNTQQGVIGMIVNAAQPPLCLGVSGGKLSALQCGSSGTVGFSLSTDHRDTYVRVP